VTNISFWLIENPFKVVLFMAFVFMFILMKDNKRAIRHRKHQMDIEKRKKEKKLLNESKS
jgi:uncharacterized membrane protein